MTIGFWNSILSRIGKACLKCSIIVSGPSMITAVVMRRKKNGKHMNVKNTRNRKTMNATKIAKKMKNSVAVVMVFFCLGFGRIDHHLLFINSSKSSM